MRIGKYRRMDIPCVQCTHWHTGMLAYWHTGIPLWEKQLSLNLSYNAGWYANNIVVFKEWYDDGCQPNLSQTDVL